MFYCAIYQCFLCTHAHAHAHASRPAARRVRFHEEYAQCFFISFHFLSSSFYTQHSDGCIWYVTHTLRVSSAHLIPAYSAHADDLHKARFASVPFSSYATRPDPPALQVLPRLGAPCLRRALLSCTMVFIDCACVKPLQHRGLFTWSQAKSLRVA